MKSETSGRRVDSWPRYQTLRSSMLKLGALQHSDLLLDILLIKALCVEQEADLLTDFLEATQRHAKEWRRGPVGV